MMEYLIDTQILLWIFGEKDKLSSVSSETVKNPDNNLYVSKASFWEIAIKLNLGKLDLPFGLDILVNETLSNSIEILEMDVNHILKVVSLPNHHRDPFDRMIISQSMVENLPVISSDEKFTFYDIKLIW